MISQVPLSLPRSQAYLQTYVQGVVRTDEETAQVQGRLNSEVSLLAHQEEQWAAAGAGRLLGYRITAIC